MDIEGVSITNKTKGKLPSLPFVEMKDFVLGKKYELSLVFVGTTLSKKLNFTYRGKDKPTNVLSFPLDRDQGEIFINPDKARIEAVEWNKPYDNFIGLLFIHGLFHLKGLDHGDEMEKLEAKALKKFNL